MKTLVLEASTYHGSVAVIDGSEVLASLDVAMRGREREAMMPAVADVLTAAQLNPDNVGRVVCGAGPGAFTSLRIAGAIAKGFALAVGAELRQVSSLALLVASRSDKSTGRFLAIADAMRGEHYVQLFEHSEAALTELNTLALIRSEDVGAYAADHAAAVIAPAFPDVAATRPSAAAAAYITNVIDSAGTVNLADWEPAYGRLAEAQVKWEREHGRDLIARA